MNASLQLILAASGFATNLMKLSEYGGVVGALGKLFFALTTSDRDLVLSQKELIDAIDFSWVGLPDQRRKPADVKKEKKKLGTTAHQDAEEFVTALLTQIDGQLSASSLVQDAFGSVSIVGETKRVLPFSLLEVPSGTGDFGATILQLAAPLKERMPANLMVRLSRVDGDGRKTEEAVEFPSELSVHGIPTNFVPSPSTTRPASSRMPALHRSAVGQWALVALRRQEAAELVPRKSRNWSSRSHAVHVREPSVVRQARRLGAIVEWVVWRRRR